MKKFIYINWKPAIVSFIDPCISSLRERSFTFYDRQFYFEHYRTYCCLPLSVLLTSKLDGLKLYYLWTENLTKMCYLKMKIMFLLKIEDSSRALGRVCGTHQTGYVFVTTTSHLYVLLTKSVYTRVFFNATYEVVDGRCLVKLSSSTIIRLKCPL